MSLQLTNRIAILTITPTPAAAAGQTPSVRNRCQETQPTPRRGRRGPLLSAGLALAASIQATAAQIEKPDLKLGFIKLTDCAPLIIAKENGYFEDEGLYVTLEAQANWKILLDRVISGELDGAHMLAGQPIASTIGYGAQTHVITAFSMDLNGNAITLSNEIWQKMKQAHPALARDPIPRPLKADLLRPVVQELKAAGNPMKMGMVFPVSTHNYELRYWLAAGGIHPGFYSSTDINGQTDADVFISVTPPPQMPATLAQGTIHGYCVGEPWNQQAVLRGIGVAPITDYEIWKNNPEKVFGVTAAWDQKYPKTHRAAVKALLRAGQWLDASLDHRRKACQILAKSEYVGADYKVIANSMTGTWEYHPGDTRPMADFNVFFRFNATYPFYSDCIWYLTQMRRWNQISEAKPDAWYHDTAKKIYRPDVYLAAAKELVQEGKLKPADLPATDGYKPPTAEFIDGILYDGRMPNAYLRQFKIGIKDEFAAQAE